MTPIHGVHQKRSYLGTVFLFGALTAMGPVGLDMYLPSVPQIAVSLEASASQTQAVFATFLVGMGIGQLVYGPLSDRLGRKLPMVIGVGIFVCGSIVCAVATTPAILIAGRFVQALGGCAGAVIARAAVRDTHGHADTASLLSLIAMVVGIAPILAPQVGAALLVFVGWRAIFWVIALFGASLFFVTIVRMVETRSAETAVQARAQHPFLTYVKLLGRGRLLRYVITGSFNGAIVYSYIAFSPVLLISIYGFSPSAYGILFGANAAIVVLSNMINSRLVRRFPPERVLAHAMTACVLLSLILSISAFIESPAGVVISIFGLLSSYGFIQGNVAACALDVDPSRSGSISALFGCLTFAGGGVGSWTVGAFANGTAVPFALVISCLACGSSIVFFFVGREPARVL